MLSPGNERCVTRDSPAGWPRIASAAFCAEPRKAIDFLCDAFGFEVELLVESEHGDLLHSQLVLGGGLVMVAGERSGATTTDFGEGCWVDRSFPAVAPEGHGWWFTQRVSGGDRRR